MIVRAGRPEERAGLEDLQRRALLMWQEYRSFLLGNPDAIAVSLASLLEKRVWVAQIQEQAVGFSVLLLRGDICDLDGLFVEPGWWGRGIGRGLVADAVARAREWGALAVETVADPRAEGFYARLGFAPTAMEQTPFGPANRMRLLAFPAQS
ncbi:MAG TPA: GNAT family N-acetyltransferase [Rhizomicrobium sp.]|jgi:GNAT superfamily N-acetyltransferase|nr:GNAT family N-acetyltransferase [Rhizomicrobium sp.]